MIFLLLHFSFLITVIVESKHHSFLLITLLIISLLLGLFYSKKLKEDSSRLRKSDFFIVLFTILGAILTFWLNQKYNLGVVLSAGIVGLVSAFIPLLKRRSEILRELPAAIYCGAFAGMTAPIVAETYPFILIAGFFTGILLINSKRTLDGYGGKLGTVAFGGVVSTSLFLYLF